MSVNKIAYPVSGMSAIGGPMAAKVPTKSRVEAHLINGSFSYSTKLMIGLGIASTTCGIILCLFGVVYALIENEITLTAIYCETSIGVWVTLNGFITIMSGSRCHSWCQLYLHMLSSLITIGLTGVLSILIANSVLHYSEFDNIYHLNRNNEIKNFDLVYNPPTVLINTLMLTFSVLSFIISVISFCISGRKVCQCYNRHKFGHNFLKDCNLDPDSISKRDRILQWIVQQSDLQLNHSHNLCNSDTKYYLSKKKLMNLHSNTTDSTRLSAYDM